MMVSDGRNSSLVLLFTIMIVDASIQATAVDLGVLADFVFLLSLLWLWCHVLA